MIQIADKLLIAKIFFTQLSYLTIRQFNIGFYTLLIILIIFKLCMQYILVKFSGASSQ